MQVAPTKWTSGALVLIFTSLMLYLFVVVAERGESPEAGEKPHREAGDKPRTGMGESRDTLFALDLDGPFMLTAVVAM